VSISCLFSPATQLIVVHHQRNGLKHVQQHILVTSIIQIGVYIST